MNYAGSQSGLKTNNPIGFENFSKRPFMQNMRGMSKIYEEQMNEKEPSTGFTLIANPEVYPF